MGARHDIKPGGPLSAEIQLVHDTYTPRFVEPDDWERIRPHVQAWLRRAAPTDRSIALRLLILFIRMIQWAEEMRLPFEVDVLFTPSMTDRFSDYLIAQGMEPTAREYRARLRRYGPLLTKPGTWPVKSQQIRRTKVFAPLSPSLESAAFTIAATHTEHHEALVILGFGAGLDGRWLPHIRGTDIHVIDGWPYVDVPEPEPRRVPIRAQYAERLVELADKFGEEYLIGGEKSVANRAWYLARYLKVNGERRLAIAELRSTWFAAHLRNNTDFRYLRRIAGAKSFNRLVEVMEFLEDPEWGGIDVEARRA